MSHSHKTKSRSGFTLVELMLAMAFISVMLVAIAMLVMQIATLYNRGATLRTINQASRSVVSDFQRTFGASDTSAIDTDVVQSHGRLCTGQYSYIWTLPEGAPGSAQINTNNRYSSGSDVLRLVRIVDKGGVYCQESVVDGSPGVNKRVNQADSQTVDLLASGDLPAGLKVRSLKVVEGQPSLASGERLYQIQLRIGTDSADAIDSASHTCKPPADLESDMQYCAVNELRFVVRTGMG